MNIDLINSIEALLYGAGRPLTLSEIKNILNNNSDSNIELSDIKKALNLEDPTDQEIFSKLRELKDTFWPQYSWLDIIEGYIAWK